MAENNNNEVIQASTNQIIYNDKLYSGINVDAGLFVPNEFGPYTVKDEDYNPINVDNGSYNEYSDAGLNRYIIVQGLQVYYGSDSADIAKTKTCPIYNNWKLNGIPDKDNSFSKDYETDTQYQCHISTSSSGPLYTDTISFKIYHIPSSGDIKTIESFLGASIRSASIALTPTTDPKKYKLKRAGLFFYTSLFDTNPDGENFPYGYTILQPYLHATYYHEDEPDTIICGCSFYEFNSGTLRWKVPFKNPAEANYAQGISKTYKRISKAEYDELVKRGIKMITIKSKTSLEYKAAKTYILQKDLKVRSGPSTASAQKYYKELSSDFKKKAYDQLFAVLKAGSKIVAMKVITNNNEVWLKIPVGYILAKNEKEIYIK